MKLSSWFFILLCIVVQFSHALARGTTVDFGQCLAEIRSGKWGTDGLLDDLRNPITNPVDTMAISYELCIRACGTGPAKFQWIAFSQHFSAWLLPWLALATHLPTGASSFGEACLGILLSIGSPCLAAYSLALTAFNNQWVANEFKEFKNLPPDHQAYIVNMLQHSQQFSLTVTSVQNDRNSDENHPNPPARQSRNWAPLAFVWVVISYGLTTATSFTIDSGDIELVGQTVALQWLWLLVVAIGWAIFSPRRGLGHCRNEYNRAIDRDYDEFVTFSRTVELRCERPTGFLESERCPLVIFNCLRLFSFIDTVGEVKKYLRPVHDNSQGMKLAPMTKYDSSVEPEPQVSKFEIRLRIVVSCILAVILQLGTTGGAVSIMYFTPTRGFECRSLAYVLYAVISFLVWFLVAKGNRVARLIGMILASSNAIGIVVVGIFQFTGFFSRCYCDSCVWELGKLAFNTLTVSEMTIQFTKKNWAVGISVSVVLLFLYAAVVWALLLVRHKSVK